MTSLTRIALALTIFLAAHPAWADEAAEVHARETAFANTMAERDFDAFGEFIAEQAVFFAGNRPLRGKQAVLGAWQPFYSEGAAPFSWRPELVEVLPSGDLALSSGPVFDPQGKCVGTFNSIWLRQGAQWKVVFDRGSSSCEFPQGEEAP